MWQQRLDSHDLLGGGALHYKLQSKSPIHKKSIEERNAYVLMVG